MLQLTEAAGAQLHQSLVANANSDNDGKCFRIVPKDESQLTLQLATPAEGDSTFEYDGSVVLALPKALRPIFEDKSLDIDESGRLRLI